MYTLLQTQIGTSLLDAAQTDPATVDERVKKGNQHIFSMLTLIHSLSTHLP